MHDASYAFLKQLLTTPSPSGYERRIQDVVRAWAKPLAEEVRTDRHGNVSAVLNPSGSPRHDAREPALLRPDGQVLA